MLGRSTVASSGLWPEPKLIEEGFAGTDGFRRGGGGGGGSLFIEDGM